MVITHKLRPMYLTCKNVTQRVDVMQDDKYSRCLEIPLRANGDDVELPEDVRAVIRYQKPDGTGGNYDTLPDGTSAYTVSGNVITVALAPQVCTVPGIVQMVVCLMQGNAEINTFVILVNVHRNPGIDAESQDYTNMRAYVKSYGWPPDKMLRTDADGNVIADDAPGGEVDPEAVQRIVEDYLAANPPMVTETDPTVPKWAKQPTKPKYTAAEVGALPDTYTPPNQTAEQVGADPAGAAASAVSQHNADATAHNDLRLLISGLTDRLNALADSDDTTLDQLSEVVAYIKSNRELIAAITTDKVGVADIVDNLTTNVANKPLSAAQGVALKALIDAISVPEALPNPNALTFSGAVTGSYDGSKPLTVKIPEAGGGASGEYIPIPASAEVGQTIVVKAVDENGKPTAWEAVTPETWEFVMADGKNVSRKVYVYANE